MARVHLSPSISVALLLLSVSALGGQQPAPAGAIYNTVKQKLADGKQVVGGTISIPDPEIYCAMATAGSTSPGSRCSTARSRTRMSRA